MGRRHSAGIVRAHTTDELALYFPSKTSTRKTHVQARQQTAVDVCTHEFTTVEPEHDDKLCQQPWPALSPAAALAQLPRRVRQRRNYGGPGSDSSHDDPRLICPNPEPTVPLCLLTVQVQAQQSPPS